MQTFELSSDNKLDGASPLRSVGNGSHGFQKEFQILIKVTTEQISILPETILDELQPREDGGISGSCSRMASSLHYVASTCIYGLQCKLFTHSDSWKCS